MLFPISKAYWAELGLIPRGKIVFDSDAGSHPVSSFPGQDSSDLANPVLPRVAIGSAVRTKVSVSECSEAVTHPAALVIEAPFAPESA